MTEEQQVAPSEATEEAVVSSEATENTEGQVEGQTAEEAPEATEEEKSESAKRRERKKAHMERLRKEAEEAKIALHEKETRLEKVRQRAEQSNTPPKESDYTDYNEYLVAMGAYHAAKTMDTREIREVEEATKAEQDRLKRINEARQAEVAQNWADQAAEAKTRYADFEQVAYTAPISPPVAHMIAASDVGADLAYYLGTNKDQAIAISRLAQFDPIEAAREIGRLEARLSLPKPNLRTNAPDPVNPVKPKPSGMKDPKKMSFEEYREARMSGKIR
jgi:hypothetical protein